MGDDSNERATIWCPYLGADIPSTEATDEHIIPLALGGHDDLTVAVDRRANSKVGSEIDGGVEKEFLIARQRVLRDVRGHSGKEKVPQTRGKEKRTRRPLTLSWGKRLRVYDHIEDRYRSGVTFETTFSIDIDIRLRFLAKCFLSAGYLVYGDLFRRAVEHWEPRLAMNKPPREFSRAEGASFRTRVLTRYDGDPPDGKQAARIEVQRAIGSLDGSVLVFVPGPGNLAIFGGVLGEYLGTLIVPADTSDFPRTDDHDRGHAIVVANGYVYRDSYSALIQRLYAWRDREVPGGAPPAAGPGSQP